MCAGGGGGGGGGAAAAAGGVIAALVVALLVVAVVLLLFFFIRRSVHEHQYYPALITPQGYTASCHYHLACTWFSEHTHTHMNCYDVATAGPGVRASCSPRSTTCMPRPRPARWSPSAAPPLRPRRSGRRSWRPATSWRASPLSLCRRLWVRAHAAGVAESAMYMLVHALVLLPSLSPCPCLAVADRMNPITVDSFRDHVNMMHDERDKGFEAEYQVTHQLHSHSQSPHCVCVTSPLPSPSSPSAPSRWLPMR